MTCQFNLWQPASAMDGRDRLTQGFVHAHVTLTDGEGKAIGGHLAPGTIVFACEVVIHAFEGPTLERGRDEVTGLPLWQD